MPHFHDASIIYDYIFFQHHLWHLWSKYWSRKCFDVLGTWRIFIQSTEKSPKLFPTWKSFIRDPVDIYFSNFILLCIGENKNFQFIFCVSDSIAFTHGTQAKIMIIYARPKIWRWKNGWNYSSMYSPQIIRYLNCRLQIK